MSINNLVRFDWAMKRLLREKGNFVVLEGFISTLLGEKITICELLESEGNQRDAADKFNRVDLLAKNSQGELIIVEVQNDRELDYFHRILYGTSKLVIDFLHKGDAYGEIHKVYSVNIIYFDLGQGEDYVYHGRTEFIGLHKKDVLQLSALQKKNFGITAAGDIFPEYYVLRVNEFDEHAVTPLDEWIAFLKTGDISRQATAPGLPEARERLRRDRLNPDEQRQYDRDMENLSYQRSVIQTGRIEGHEEGWKEGHLEGLQEGRQEGLQEGLEQGHHQEKLEMARKMKNCNMDAATISALTGLNPQEIESC